MDRVVVYSTHSPRYHGDGAFASGTVLLRSPVLYAPRPNFFRRRRRHSNCRRPHRSLSDHSFSSSCPSAHLHLSFQSQHQSLPFGFLAVLICTPCPELFLLLLAEETINLWGYHLFSSLKFFGSFAPFDFVSDLSLPLFNPEMFRSLLFSRVARFSTVVDKYCWHSWKSFNSFTSPSTTETAYSN